MSDDNTGDMAEYSPKSEFSKPLLVQGAVVDCRKARAMEMRAGYYTEKVDQQGNLILIWNPDNRDLFMSAIDALYGLLYPERQRDEIYPKFEEYLEKKKNELFKIYSYKEWEIERNEKGMRVWKKTDKNYMPTINEGVLMRKNQAGLFVGKILRGGWDSQVNRYKNEMIKLYDEIFEQLNGLVDRNNYFKSKGRF